MATTKLGSSKSAGGSITYAEKRAEVKSGLNCDVDYAMSTFKATRELYNKPNGVQAHTIIQSFKPGEVTPEKANEIGQELAREVTNDNYQVAIYTHTDKAHIHNHIIINAVGFKDGKKYQSNAKQRHLVKDLNDKICRQHNLSVPKKDTARVRYTLTEQEILKKDGISWKDELRQAIPLASAKSSNFDDLGRNLENNFDIEFKKRGNTISYRHPDQKRWVRAKKLGADFDKEALENEFTRQIERAETKGHSEGYNKLSRELDERARQHQQAIEDNREQSREFEQTRSIERDVSGPEL